MIRHRVTIRDVAIAFGLTLKRVRYVRQHGGPFDWPEIIVKTEELKRDWAGPSRRAGRG